MHVTTEEQQATREARVKRVLSSQPDDVITRYILSNKGRKVPLYVRLVFWDAVLDLVPDAKAGLYYHYRQRNQQETEGKRLIVQYYTTLAALDSDLLRLYHYTIND